MVAEIIINSIVKTLNRVFDYNIPEELADKIKIGSRVLVPFGNGKKLEDGFVINIKQSSEYKIKDIVKFEEQVFSKENIELAKWMSNRYFCNISDCLKLMLPPGTATKELENRTKEKLINFVYLAKETDTSAQKTTNTYGKYRPSYIPKKVLAGSQTSGAWTNLFNSNKKVVFYVYDKNDKFHDEFFNYFSNSDYSKYYDFKPTSKSTFNGMMTGTVGPSKICNSIEECNKYREKASNYTLLTNFLSSCGKGMCIFKPEKNQFVQLRRRTTKDASNMLEELKNW